MVVILDLRFGECSLLSDRPENRLGTLVEPAIDEKFADLANDLCFGRIGHRGVRILPIADHPEPLEIALLDFDPVSRELAAFAPKLVNRHVVLGLVLGPIPFLNDPLDRQSVAVPARHVGGILAEHLLRAVDDVLQNLVERGSEVKFAIGVRGAVVEDEFFAPA